METLELDSTVSKVNNILDTTEEKNHEQGKGQ
jgi:hypothetical protein